MSMWCNCYLSRLSVFGFDKIKRSNGIMAKKLRDPLLLELSVHPYFMVHTQKFCLAESDNNRFTISIRRQLALIH